MVCLMNLIFFSFSTEYRRIKKKFVNGCVKGPATPPFLGKGTGLLTETRRFEY